MDILIFLIVCYLIGSIPFGIVVTDILNLKGLSTSGSGNTGATNVARLFGLKLGLFVLLADGAKGALSVILCRFFFSNNEELALLSGAITTLGHVFSPWLGFRGGKGVASSVFSIVCFDPKIGIITIFLWTISFSLTRYSSLASIISISASCIAGAMFSESGKISYLLIMTIIMFRHVDNMARLINNTEHQFSTEKGRSDMST